MEERKRLEEEARKQREDQAKKLREEEERRLGEQARKQREVEEQAKTDAEAKAKKASPTHNAPPRAWLVSSCGLLDCGCRMLMPDAACELNGTLLRNGRLGAGSLDRQCGHPLPQRKHTNQTRTRTPTLSHPSKAD